MIETTTAATGGMGMMADAASAKRLAEPPRVTALLRDLIAGGKCALTVASLHGAAVTLPPAAGQRAESGTVDTALELVGEAWRIRLDLSGVRSAAFVEDVTAGKDTIDGKDTISGKNIISGKDASNGKDDPDGGSPAYSVRLLSLGGDDILRAAFPAGLAAAGDRALWDELRARHAGPPWIADTRITRRGPVGDASGPLLQAVYDACWETGAAGVIVQTRSGALELFTGFPMPTSVITPNGVLDVNEGVPTIHVHLELPSVKAVRFYDDFRGVGWRRFLVKFVDVEGLSHLDIYLANPYRAGVPGGQQPAAPFDEERERSFLDLYERFAGEPGVQLVTARPLAHG